MNDGKDYKTLMQQAAANPDANTWHGERALRFMVAHHGKELKACIEQLPEHLVEGSIVEVSHSHTQPLPTRAPHTAHHHAPAQLGFGHGEGLKLLLDKYPHRPLIGVDVSESMVELVSAWPQAQGPSPRLRAAVGDPCAGLSLEEGSVALSFNMNCVYFWSDLEAGARELYRVAAPGGVAVTVLQPKHAVRFQRPPCRKRQSTCTPHRSQAKMGDTGPFKHTDLLTIVKAFRAAAFETVDTFHMSKRRLTWASTSLDDTKAASSSIDTAVVVARAEKQAPST